MLFLMGLMGLHAQDEVKSHLLVAKVVKQDSITPVPFAFVANSYTGLGKETDDAGMFKMSTNLNDTIFFRSLGYETAILRVNEAMLNDTLLWIVQEKTYELGSVDVLMFKSYASFKHAIANMDMMPDKSIGMPITIDMREIRRAIKEKSNTFGVGVGFGSAQTRAERKYAAFQANEKKYERFREMTSRENMQYLTKLEGEKLDDFMVFLRTKHRINPDLDDYKMMEAINQVFEDFLALNTDTIAQ